MTFPIREFIILHSFQNRLLNNDIFLGSHTAMLYIIVPVDNLYLAFMAVHFDLDLLFLAI